MVPLFLRKRGTSQHVRGVDIDRDRYRSVVRELKRDCAIPESFSRFDRSRLEAAIHGVSFRLIIQPESSLELFIEWERILYERR